MQSLLKGANETGHVPNEEKVRLIAEYCCSFVIALVQSQQEKTKERQQKYQKIFLKLRLLNVQN